MHSCRQWLVRTARSVLPHSASQQDSSPLRCLVLFCKYTEAASWHDYCFLTEAHDEPQLLFEEHCS